MTSVKNRSIVFIDNSDSDFTGLDLNTTKVRGTESSMILLSESMVRLGIRVVILNCTKKEVRHNNVTYINKKNIPKEKFDVCVAVSNANKFKNIKAKKYVLWSNSLQSIEKFIRKKQLIPFLKFKPVVMTMCNYQYNKRSFLTSFYGKMVISLTVDPVFFKEPINVKYVPNKYALNNIRSHRNLDWLINIWKNYIYKENSNEFLYINPNIIDNDNDLIKYNIKLRKYVSRKELLNELKETRVFVYTGHKSDVWTLTAEEAVQMCVPVVTYGIGSVSDRVKHGKNGFIVNSDDEFAYYLKKLLSDDEFYLNIKDKMYRNRGLTSWDTIALEWINKFHLN
jgi:glycosyltransferase involved in cell wall biosynthesis